jgi:hypothetical protein
MRLYGIPLALLLSATAFSAQASYVTVTYQGVVSQVMNPAEAPGITQGDVVTYSATFDPSTAVNVGSTLFNIDGITGLPVDLSHISTISLSDDPLASESLTIGAWSFTQADDPTFGHNYGLGAGNFPFVVYNGTQLLGLDMGAVTSSGLYFYSDPIAVLLHHSPSTGYGGLETSDDLSFLVTTDLDGAIAGVTAVPEPSTWLMMALAGALLARGLRARPWNAPSRAGMSAAA